MIEGINPVPPQNAADFNPTGRQKEEARLKDASKQFEQVFMKQMLSEMRKSVDKSKLFGEGKDEDTFQDMLDNERAKSWSDSGGVGLAQLIYEQMRNQISDKPGRHGPASSSPPARLSMKARSPAPCQGPLLRARRHRRRKD